MGFLRRVLGGGNAHGNSPPSIVETPQMSARGFTLNVNYFARIRDDAMLPVVGEYYRQQQVATARKPGAGDLPPGLPPPPPGYYKAMLILEPTNQYDPNAIAVYLWAGGDWSMAGYLSRTNATNYQPLFRHLASGKSSPPAIACDAALTSERGGVGVVLHLGTPGECIVELATDDRTPADHAWAAKAVVFTGQGATTVHGIPLDRPAQIMLARWAGCNVLPRLIKKTDALIVADPGELTANLQKASEYGVAIVQEPEFVAALGIPAETIGRLSGRWARL